jgi:hypothetical protein
MKSKNYYNDLIKKYEKNPIIRGLIQLIPFGIGSAVDVSLITHFHKFQYERARTFFDELFSGKVILTTDLINSEDFLHAYFATFKAALNSRRREKIKMFAQMLSSAVTSNILSNIDEYEECLQILDELSCRELLLLNILEKHEKRYELHKGENENKAKKSSHYLDEFFKEAQNTLSITREEVNAMLSRIKRTGCFETFAGKYWIDSLDNQGELTVLYYKYDFRPATIWIKKQ